MEISALDENGNAVDWWFAYKVPKMAQDGNTAAATGYEYVYYDPNIGKVVQSANVLTDGKGALDLTIASIFSNPADSTGWILYNDEMPADAQRADSSSFGHTKGVLAFDTASKTALWLLHSWPKYADPKSADMPTPIYGQTFLCVSLDLATAGKIAAQMANHQEPQVYLTRVPSGLDQADPLYALTQTLNPNAPGDADVVDCTSRGGLPFKVIAKNRKWGKDFWNDLVGPTLNEDIDVETWIRGAIPPTQDSDGVHQTYDVKYIDLRQLGMPWTWPETHDHAKWAISVESDWICVGDINRMVSQEKRGGGTIAFQDSRLWAALSKTDLIVPPPGYSQGDAKALVKSTHQTADTAA
ncbi:deoxyribonuclease II family protein [Pseudoduganella ginsengisoli]|uniref:Deoxyribonuclease n=1 Tax=Pseudoduganella ginsengisoli TaxID=1462440 RepID=A0A6L6PX73_9BURK|nr:deoxyribonuclease II family protein [Pseudoduganella ginsengisoli]MTW01731.1 deoxyribonuclease [Pseudoduganella ginsengisoli]